MGDCMLLFFLMVRRPPRSTRTDTLFPYTTLFRSLKSLEEMRLSRICRAMRQAAISGSVFHLWWHPHNFGADIAENMAFLRRILESYRQLADEYGMTISEERRVGKDGVSTGRSRWWPYH